jgi:hypothetical protein
MFSYKTSKYHKNMKKNNFFHYYMIKKNIIYNMIKSSYEINF